MNSTEILDAVNARLLEKWPERRTYINVCPVIMSVPLSGSRSRAMIVRRSRSA